MAVEVLPELFGSGTGYVAGAILAVLTVLVLAAFRQGRTIQFWPPNRTTLSWVFQYAAWPRHARHRTG